MVDSEGGEVMRTKTTITLSDINNESNKPSVCIPVCVITGSDYPQTLLGQTLPSNTIFLGQL